MMMKTELRVIALLITTPILMSAACRNKPAYSEMDANKTAKVENSNSGEQASVTPPPEPVPAQSPPPVQTRQFKLPTFLDPTNGSIKDLPSYPGARKTNQIIGPAEGTNAATTVYTSADSMEKIAAFYERVIKVNKWVVSNKLIDPDVSEWVLKKGEDDNAKVSVNKDSNTGHMTIFMVRSEKLEQPPK
jgi:hypothetical protein